MGTGAQQWVSKLVMITLVMSAAVCTSSVSSCNVTQGTSLFRNSCVAEKFETPSLWITLEEPIAIPLKETFLLLIACTAFHGSKRFARKMVVAPMSLVRLRHAELPRLGFYHCDSFIPNLLATHDF
jgi:hypothetical protein